MVVSIENAEHYIWGEAMHYHNTARQFFYILEGEGTMSFEDRDVILRKGDGIEIVPKTKHQFKNQSDVDVHFLVLSVPSTRGDRINL